VSGLPGAIRTLVAGLNDADELTGTSVGTSVSQTFVWTVATGAQPIGSPGGIVFSGGPINIRGQIAFNRLVNTDLFSPVYHAFRFTPGVGIFDLGTLGGSSRSLSIPSSINADGDVVGYSYDPATVTMKGFLYTDRGGMIALGSLGGRQTIPNDINDNGGIVGDATPPDCRCMRFCILPPPGWSI
jgi:probable HAF family extracellular repeat protein